MRKLFFIILTSAIISCAGCNSDIVTTKQLKIMDYKCVYIKPLDSEDPYVGQVVRDVIEKELLRRKVILCDENNATIFLSGSTFLTSRSVSSNSTLEAIESVSIVGRNSNGELLLSASYDNKDHYTASKLAKEFGSALAGKLK